ncbi:MAG TPA: WXG100 family type VII secretion target [Candidatus Dormibacteraeota bacterium]|nr:WXG100 family type VII secretion target [Candidatus Dormibacteraeota bacterium]
MAGVGGGFEVDFNQLLKTAEYALALVPQMKQNASKANEAAEYLHSTWQGKKATEFRQLYATWQQDHRQILQALDNIGSQLQRSYQLYLQSDEA